MEDEDDSYGFGSLAGLFESAPTGEIAASASSQLDLEASRQLWMSRGLHERLAAEEKASGAYQHVGAKIDGCAVEGGLGRLRVVQDGEERGVAWMQAVRSDSNAQEKRKRALEGEERSATALFVPGSSIKEVKATTIQNRVQGVDLVLHDGHMVQFAFLPGPYYDAGHCDFFLQDARKLLQSAEGKRAQATVSNGDSIEQLQRRDEMRKLVRQYARLNQSSDEAIQLARKVHEATGYPIGPLVKKVPRFASDEVYRKKAVQDLTQFLSKMNEEWTRADEHREMRTQTKSFRNQDDLLQYTDTITGEDISPRTYESRYSVYAKLDDHDPFVPCIGPSGIHEGDHSTSVGLISHKAELSTLLGVDVSSSCIIDDSFFTDPAEEDALTSSGAKLPPGLTTASHASWSQWGEEFLDYIRSRGAAIRGQDPIHADKQSSRRSALKRSRDRRRSIVPAPLHELIDLTGEEPSSCGPRQSFGERQRRSPSPESKSPATERKRRRRQSVIGSVEVSSLDEQESEGEPRECRLCFGAEADIEMTPCGHRVCASCWSRLADSDGPTMCPWDREPVGRVEQ